MSAKQHSLDTKGLGSACPKGKRRQERTVPALAEASIEAKFDHVTNMGQIMSSPITSAPGRLRHGSSLGYGAEGWHNPIMRKRAIAALIAEIPGPRHVQATLERALQLSL